MKLLPKLSPFWFTPLFQTEEPPVRFRLRPLTQAEMTDVEDLFEEGVWTRPALFKAGMLSILECENIVDANGKAIVWPHGIDVPGTQIRDLVCHSGLRIVIEMGGHGTWDDYVNKRAAADAQPAEVQPAKT